MFYVSWNLKTILNKKFAKYSNLLRFSNWDFSAQNKQSSPTILSLNLNGNCAFVATSHTASTKCAPSFLHYSVNHSIALFISQSNSFPACLIGMEWGGKSERTTPPPVAAAVMAERKGLPCYATRKLFWISSQRHDPFIENSPLLLLRHLHFLSCRGTKSSIERLVIVFLGFFVREEWRLQRQIRSCRGKHQRRRQQQRTVMVIKIAFLPVTRESLVHVPGGNVDTLFVPLSLR